MKKTFKVTENHIKLLNHAYVGWNDCEFGAPSIECKRPYGNGNAIGDITKILFGDIPEDVGEALSDYAIQLHRELEVVLQIVLVTKSFETGTYERDEYLARSWRKVS